MEKVIWELGGTLRDLKSILAWDMIRDSRGNIG